VTRSLSDVAFWAYVVTFIAALVSGALAGLRLRSHHPQVMKALSGHRLPKGWREVFPGLGADQPFVRLLGAFKVFAWSAGILFVSMLILGRIKH